MKPFSSQQTVLTGSLPYKVTLCVWSCCGLGDRNTQFQTNINVTDSLHWPLLWKFHFTHHLKISHKCSTERICSYLEGLHWMYIIFTAYSCYWIKAPFFFHSCLKATQSFLLLFFITFSFALSGMDLIQQIRGIIAFSWIHLIGVSEEHTECAACMGHRCRLPAPHSSSMQRCLLWMMSLRRESSVRKWRWSSGKVALAVIRIHFAFFGIITLITRQ